MEICMLTLTNRTSIKKNCKNSLPLHVSFPYIFQVSNLKKKSNLTNTTFLATNLKHKTMYSYFFLPLHYQKENTRVKKERRK